MEGKAAKEKKSRYAKDLCYQISFKRQEVVVNFKNIDMKAEKQQQKKPHQPQYISLEKKKKQIRPFTIDFGVSWVEESELFKFIEHFYNFIEFNLVS